jgi:hypothetical protein
VLGNRCLLLYTTAKTVMAAQEADSNTGEDPAPQITDPYASEDPGPSVLTRFEVVQQFCRARFNLVAYGPASQRELRRSIPIRGFGVSQTLDSLSPADFLAYFPADAYGGLQHRTNHYRHPCRRVAEAATVHQLTVALLAEAFLVLRRLLRLLGYYQLYNLWDGLQREFAVPAFVGANQVEHWQGMTNTERAALLLFVNPPTKLCKAGSGQDMEACLSVCTPGHRR